MNFPNLCKLISKYIYTHTHTYAVLHFCVGATFYSVCQLLFFMREIECVTVQFKANFPERFRSLQITHIIWGKYGIEIRFWFD